MLLSWHLLLIHLKNRLDRVWGNQDVKYDYTVHCSIDRSWKQIRVLYEIKFKLLYIKFDYYDLLLSIEAVNSLRPWNIIDLTWLNNADTSCVMNGTAAGRLLVLFIYASVIVCSCNSYADMTYWTPVKCGLRNAENRKRVKCGMLHAEKYCRTKGKMRKWKMRNGNKIGKTNWRVTILKKSIYHSFHHSA